MNLKFVRIALIVLLFAGALTACKKADHTHIIDPRMDITNFITDSIFRDYCVTEFGDGHRITAGQAAAVKTIYVNMVGVRSMEGIKYFTGLEDLDCSNNIVIPELDLTTNTALIRLACSANELTLLNISKCMALVELNCEYNKVTALDVTNKAALTTLNCGSNLLTELDVSGNKALTTLDCSYNNMTNLIMSDNALITDLKCNVGKLTSLDVSKCSKLKSLNCSSNKLTTLDLPTSTSLRDLNCRFNKLTILDISNIVYLEFLFCERNPDLTTIYVWRGFDRQNSVYKDSTANFVEK